MAMRIMTATFRYFVGFHIRAIRCASAISAGVRLRESAVEFAERVEALKALEADRRLQAEHERVLAERDRLAEEMERMAEPIVKIAHTVTRIAICDREIGRLNAISAAKFGLLSGAAPAVAALFQDAVVWDAFTAVARVQPPPVVFRRGKRKGQTARRAISQFASDVLAEVEADANSHFVIRTRSKSKLLRPVRRAGERPQMTRNGGGSRRIADVADRGLGRLIWAESAPTRVASKTTGVRAKAAFRCEREIRFTAQCGAAKPALPPKSSHWRIALSKLLFETVPGRIAAISELPRPQSFAPMQTGCLRGCRRW
jgi:hypothetical protein